MQNRRLIGAGVGRRAAAVTIDLVVMSPALFLVARVFGHSTMVVTLAGTTYNYTMDLSGLVFSMLVIVVYHTVLEGLFGRTVGKLVTGLVVVNDDGSPVDLGAALVRNLLRVVDGFFFYLVAAIAVWASPTHQRFGDKAAHMCAGGTGCRPAGRQSAKLRSGSRRPRPSAYLDPRVRSGISYFSIIDEDLVAAGLKRLSEDLASGEWDRRFGPLRQLEELDTGQRLIVAGV